MKIFFALWFAFLFAVSDVIADEVEVSGTSHGTKINVQTVCLDGKLFAVASVGTHHAKLYGVALEQVYEPRPSGYTPQPVTCGENK